MSSTNRKNSSDRHIADYYVTPIASIKEFLDAFREDYPMLQTATMANPYDRPSMVLDPCAGGDPKHEMSYPWSIEKFSGWQVSLLDSVDVRPDSKATFKEDFLFRGIDGCYDIAITNPPFNIALDVIQKCLREVKEGGLVIMLLRLNFFGSQERSAWFKQNMPMACYVHSKRMKFTDSGGSDSVEYMHCIWLKGEHPRFTKLRIL